MVNARIACEISSFFIDFALLHGKGGHFVWEEAGVPKENQWVWVGDFLIKPLPEMRIKPRNKGANIAQLGHVGHPLSLMKNIIS